MATGQFFDVKKEGVIKTGAAGARVIFGTTFIATETESMRKGVGMRMTMLARLQQAQG